MLANSKTRVIKCELDRDEYAMEAGKILKQMCAKINGITSLQNTKSIQMIFCCTPTQDIFFKLSYLQEENGEVGGLQPSRWCGRVSWAYSRG